MMKRGVAQMIECLDLVSVCAVNASSVCQNVRGEV
jgi:hypothetical protein